jgi:NAD(P)-dependent dehydrogenase (short-subunit alcohol dehydrogenase family)
VDIVVTGASSGIGAALTKALIADGHRLSVCARRVERLAALTGGGRDAAFRKVDVADERQVLDFAADVERVAGGVDALICCAGAYGPIGPVSEVDSSEWLQALQANLFGTFLSVRAFLPLLSKRRRARIITFSGGGAFNPLPNYSAYAVAKAGIVRLTETLADELKPTGIAVNGVAPGFVRTEIHDATLAAGPELAGEAFYEMTQAKLREGAVPMEVPVSCVRFLLSDAADGLTGKTLSASFDPWSEVAFTENIEALNASELYTMRRMNLVNLPDDEIVQRLARAKRRQ